jgi:hypothetical protein
MPTRDWQGQWLRPLFHKNGQRWHFNWMKGIEIVLTGLLTAFLIFVGGRFIVYEKDTLAQASLSKDQLKLCNDIAYLKFYESITDLGDVVHLHLNEESIKDRKASKLALDIYKKNKKERKDDLDRLLERLEMKDVTGDDH